MAEISYPFSADSAGGGQQMMSQTQWQYMARAFGKDRVDFRLTATSIDGGQIPFRATITSGTTVNIAPGRAFVGGFYYTLTATQAVTITSNTSTLPRIDLIVLRADLGTGSVNLAVVKGQAAATPKPPALTRAYGGRWEMPLHQVTVPAASGALSLVNVMPFDTVEHVAIPWNAPYAGALLENGTFVMDMDSNNNDWQTEYFVGRDGFVPTRDFSKARTYTPSMVGIGNPATRQGRWRWIAPNAVWFSVYIASTSSSDLKLNKGNWTCGVTLPVPANAATGQIFTGHLDNNGDGHSTELPNFMSITAKVNRGNPTSTMYLYYPNKNYSTNSGLDGLPLFPRKGYLTISGVYEAAKL
ncbi:hypothetical protein AB0L74_10270 [Streptomyces sp. NPDC052020]|uniref:hypothetical protein n=1 Tax=Streptomyces sp. NPDC052020 TaxID=3155677 RepID=UPI003423EB6B